MSDRIGKDELPHRIAKDDLPYGKIAHNDGGRISIPSQNSCVPRRATVPLSQSASTDAVSVATTVLLKRG
jgi:hypothetical protein